MSPEELTNYLRTLKNGQIFIVRVINGKRVDYDVFKRTNLFDTLEGLAFEYTRINRGKLEELEILQLYQEEIFYELVPNEDLSVAKIVKV